jgi:hypothetical protein
MFIDRCKAELTKIAGGYRPQGCGVFIEEV